MKTLIVLDTVVLGLLCVLMVGLLRSHAEILRRDAETATGKTMNKPAGESSYPGLDELPEPRTVETDVVDILGETPHGGGMKVALGQGSNTLVAFLSSGCMTCMAFWEGLRGLTPDAAPAQARIIIVTKDSMYESPSRLMELAAGSPVPVIMSSAAWNDYRVEMSPYFIYVDGTSGKIASEGAASSWPQVFSLLRDAIGDSRFSTKDQVDIGEGPRL